MSTISRFIRKEWFAIILLGALAYAVWGDDGQKKDIYTKGGVSITLVSSTDASMEVIGDALEQDQWIYNGRCSNCPQFVVTLDSRSGVYKILDLREDMVFGYYSDPEEVYWQIQDIQKDIGTKSKMRM